MVAGCDRFDYDGALAAARDASREFAVIGPWVSFFEIYCQLRGLEQAMIDLALNPDLVDGVLDRVEAIQTGMMKRFLAAPAIPSTLSSSVMTLPGKRGS